MAGLETERGIIYNGVKISFSFFDRSGAPNFFIVHRREGKYNDTGDE
jgi:hypothetical protein